LMADATLTYLCHTCICMRKRHSLRHWPRSGSRLFTAGRGGRIRISLSVWQAFLP